MKNSTMLFQTLLNEPKNQDVYRAYADALMEEGEEEKGNYLAAKLGKTQSKRVIVTDYTIHAKTIPPFTDLARLIMPHRTAWVLTVKNGFVTHIHMPLFDFMLVYEALFKQQPIQGVQFTDRSPRTSFGKAYWYEGSANSDTSSYALYGDGYERHRLLPSEIIARFLFDTPLVRLPATFKDAFCFPSIKEAFQAVSVAAVKLGREKAGLVPLPKNGYGRIRGRNVYTNW